MQEIETKIELSAASFARLLSCCTVIDDVEQLNVYYDCGGAISDRSGSLRIRFVKGVVPLMTLKLPIEQNHGKRVSTEIEAPFTRRLPPRVLNAMELPVPLRLHVSAVCKMAPHRLGAMRTRRLTVRLPNDDVVEMDEVRLPDGRTFHEVEIESHDPAVHRSALAVVQQVATDWKMSERGKFQRFRQALGNL